MAAGRERAVEPGIYVRHQNACLEPDGGRCSCRPTFRAAVHDPVRRKPAKSRWVRTLAAARRCKRDLQRQIDDGTLTAPTRERVAEALDALIAGMRDGVVLDRSGNPYKPATIRGYETKVRKHVAPRIGSKRVSAVRRRDVQAIVDEMRAEGLAPSTVKNAVDPLRVLFRRARWADEIAVVPTEGLMLPGDPARRDRIEAPTAAAALLVALPEEERPFWALALFAGMRRGELRALRWADVDFETGVIRVEHGWDDKEGEQDGKSHAARRKIPMAKAVRSELAAHKLRTGRGPDDLVLGRTARDPFVPSTVRTRALQAWGWKQVPNPDGERPRRVWVKAREDALEPLTPHEARHCAASYFIACGLDIKQVSAYLGHVDVRVTLNRYGHLIPGSEREAADKLDALLEGRA